MYVLRRTNIVCAGSHNFVNCLLNKFTGSRNNITVTVYDSVCSGQKIAQRVSVNGISENISFAVDDVADGEHVGFFNVKRISVSDQGEL